MHKKEKILTKNYRSSFYDKPSVTTDVLVFTIENKKLKILLIKRKNPPFKGKWAIPGGFVEMDENLEECALRELKEETGIENANLIQLHTFGKPDRDPRTRVITVAYITFIPYNQLRFKANSDAKQVRLFPVYTLPKLAFDHSEIVKFAIEFIKGHIFKSNFFKHFLPEKIEGKEM